MSLYLNAVASAKERELLDSVFFSELKNAKNFDAVIKLMHNSPYNFEGSKNIEKVLEDEEKKLYDFVKREGDEEFKTFLNISNDYDNALYLVKSLSKGKKENSVPLYAGNVGITKLSNFILSYESQHLEENNRLEKDIKLFLSQKLDNANLFFLTKKIHALNERLKKTQLKHFVGLVTDLTNLSLVFMSKNEEILEGLSVYIIDKKTLLKIIKKEKVVLTDKLNIYSRLIKLAQKDSSEKNFLEFKKERENVLFEFLKLDNDIESPNIFIKFILKKLIEIKRLRQILLQKKYDLL